MRIAAVYSEGDPAGSGAASKLLELRRWRASSCARAVSCYLDESGAVLAGFREDVLYFDFLDEVLDADAYVVLSRHSSRSGRPSLTVHTTGNYADAQFGGRPRELAWSNPRLEGALLRAYASAARELGLTGRYWVGLEATHHGPTNLLRPITFIEVGSSPAEWSDGEAQMAMAVAVDSVLSSEPPACPAAAGFGGTHYPEKHTALVLRGEAC